MFSSRCNYFLPGGLAFRNNERSLGGPSVARVGQSYFQRSNIWAIWVAKPKRSFSAGESAADALWTPHLKNKCAQFPPAQTTRSRLECGHQTHSPQKTLGIQNGHRRTTMRVCTPLGVKAWKEDKQIICCSLWQRAPRPQHNTQHNGNSKRK